MEGNIPPEILIQIFTLCGPIARLACTAVCKSWYNVIQSHKWHLASKFMVSMEKIRGKHNPKKFIYQEDRMHPFDDAQISDTMRTLVIHHLHVSSYVICNILTVINPSILQIQGYTYSK